MRVVQLGAGAAGMYCGSCMHDNRLAAALRAQGRDVVLLPLYTPLRSDEPDVSTGRIFYGGINVYLQQTIGLFRHTPRFVDRLLDSPRLLRAVGGRASGTRPETLGELTLSVLDGQHGRQRRELEKLVDGLRQLHPALVHLPNLMFVGVAERLKAELGVPIVCSLAGEDIFVDRLPEPYRAQVFERIAARAADIDGFIALTDYYANHAARRFALPRERIHRIPMGIRVADFAEPCASPEVPAEPFTIGYLARVCPEKGLAELARAFALLKQAGRRCRLRAAGYLSPADRPYLDRVYEELGTAGITVARTVERSSARRVRPTANVGHGGPTLRSTAAECRNESACPGADFEYVGEVTRAEKLRFLRCLSVLSVPTTYAESKGFYVLEALAAGVPVVQPAHGSLPELVNATGGGLLYAPGDPQALAAALARLMDDSALRRRLGSQGRAAVQRDFSTERMAAAAWRVYTQYR